MERIASAAILGFILGAAVATIGGLVLDMGRDIVPVIIWGGLFFPLQIAGTIILLNSFGFTGRVRTAAVAVVAGILPTVALTLLWGGPAAVFTPASVPFLMLFAVSGAAFGYFMSRPNQTW